jgi:endonuclease-3
MNATQIERFFATLKATNPQPASELEYTTVFELLAAVLLSAQATDVGVNKATRRLFPVANTPQAILALGEEGLEDHIKTIGLYRNKAKHLMQTCRILVDAARRRGAAQPRGAGGPARRGPQDGQRGAERGLRRADDGGGHAHLPRQGNRTGLAPGKTPLAGGAGLLKRVPPAYRWTRTTG